MVVVAPWRSVQKDHAEAIAAIAPSHPGWWGRRERLFLLALAGLWVVSTALNLRLAWRAGPLDAEEIKSSFLNPVLATHRLQCDVSTSNTGAIDFFALLRPTLYPRLGDMWFRDVKCVLAGAVPAMLALFARNRLGVSRWLSVFAGLVAVVTPALYAYSWQAFEDVIDLVPGLLALYIATGPLVGRQVRSPWALAGRVVAAGLLSGLAASFYAGSVPLVIVCALVPWLWSRVDSRPHRLPAALGWRCVATFSVVGSAALVIAATAAVFTNSHHVLVGGGTQAPVDIRHNVSVLLGDFKGTAHSYYFLSVGPAITVLVLLLGAAGVVAGLRHRVMWSLIALGALSTASAVLTAPPTGVRRMLPAVCVIVLAAAVAVDWIRRHLPGPGPAVATFVAGLALMFSGLAYQHDSHALITSQLVTSNDVTFPHIAGQTRDQTLAEIDRTFPAFPGLADPKRIATDWMAPMVIARRDARGADTTAVWDWWYAHTQWCVFYGCTASSSRQGLC
jgi:hypothetical protein